MDGDNVGPCALDPTMSKADVLGKPQTPSERTVKSKRHTSKPGKRSRRKQARRDRDRRPYVAEIDYGFIYEDVPFSDRTIVHHVRKHRVIATVSINAQERPIKDLRRYDLKAYARLTRRMARDYIRAYGTPAKEVCDFVAGVLRREILGIRPGRPRSKEVDAAERHYRAALRAKQKPNWDEITRQTHPGYDLMDARAQRLQRHLTRTAVKARHRYDQRKRRRAPHPRQSA